MISISSATEKDYRAIVNIGKMSVTEAHTGSCAPEELNEYIEGHYNKEEIIKELSDVDNIYHIIYYKLQPVGFSKIIFNAKHPNIPKENVTKLDRIYLLKEFQGMKLGFKLLQFNIELAKNHHQSGMWLFTWVGNKKAIEFYLKAGFKIIGSHDFYVTKTRSNPNHHMLLDFSEAVHT